MLAHLPEADGGTQHPLCSRVGPCPLPQQAVVELWVLPLKPGDERGRALVWYGVGRNRDTPKPTVLGYVIALGGEGEGGGGSRR